MSFEKEIVKVINKDQQEVEQKKDFAIERDKEKDSSKVINIDNLEVIKNVDVQNENVNFEVQEKSLYVENNNNNFVKTNNSSLDSDFVLNNKNVSFRKNAIDVDNIYNYNQENKGNVQKKNENVNLEVQEKILYVENNNNNFVKTNNSSLDSDFGFK
jgi:hypothetical protein